MRMTEEEYNAFISRKPQKKPSKYRNQKALGIDFETKEQIEFDSIKERDYFYILKDREKRGEIKDLARQVPLIIQPAFTDKSGKKHRAIEYRADFYYITTKDKLSHVVDVKGYKTEVYKIKKKLLAYQGIIIEEV